jgi:hypothetical protein
MIRLVVVSLLGWLVFPLACLAWALFALRTGDLVAWLALATCSLLAIHWCLTFAILRRCWPMTRAGRCILNT